MHIMRKDFKIKNTDLNMYQCGTEECNPWHDFGPAVRDHYLIHVIEKGEGIFQVFTLRNQDEILNILRQ